MLDMVFRLFGGIGLFLMGMGLLSDGLVGFAGNALRRGLLRFTGTPWRAFTSGALTTMAIQSSTATTVTLIGFVSAGLIAYSQAIGVVIGASLGTTTTGWFVAGLGLKVNLGYYTLPLIGLGAFMRLLGKGRWKHLGLAFAGFGMLFLGLSTMQEGMQDLSQHFDLRALPSEGFWAHVMAMLVGILLTTLLQSSTAAVATTLTALATGTIVFEQAASVVVGAAIGTTLTGALVSIGGTVAAKRTALAHILFNLGSGLIAIIMLPVFLAILDWLQSVAGLEPGAMALAAFHTMFIAVGVLLFMPFVGRFGNFVARMLPERKQDMSRHLDSSALGLPSVALEASQRALESITHQLMDVLKSQLHQPLNDTLRNTLQLAGDGLNDALQYLARLHIPQDDPLHAHRVAQLHAIDHLLRLQGRLLSMPDLSTMEGGEQLSEVIERMEAILILVHSGIDGEASLDWPAVLQEHSLALRDAVQVIRARLLDTEQFEGGLGQALQLTDTLRWLERSAAHVQKICHYLLAGRQAPVK